MRDEIERKGQFWDGILRRCTCSSGAPGRTRAVRQPVRRLAAVPDTQHVPGVFNGKGSTQKPFRCSHMKPLLPALSSELRRRFFKNETSNNCRLGNNLTTALLSQSSLVRLEF